MKTFALSAVLSAFLSLVVSSQPASAQLAAGPIDVWDQGSCWVQQRSLDGKTIGYQIASFGSGNAFQLTADDVNGMAAWTTEQLKTRFTSSPAYTFEVALHCYSAGHMVTVQVERPGFQPLCLHAKAKSGNAINDLELVALRPDVEWRPGFSCFGIEERSIGLSLKVSSEDSVNRIRAAIANNRTLAEIVESVEYRPGAFFALAKLKAPYAFREVEAKAKLESSPLVGEEVSLVWLNGIQLIDGENHALFQGKTQAY